jgi:TPP-dependent pyruvate/acetoin dehydrogenase alpha subunit
MTPDKSTIARLYHSMLLIRRAEEYVAEVYPTDAVKSPVHLSIGQESIAVGVCDPLKGDDLISNTYRGHATYLAKGGDLRQFMAELYGKSGGCAAGKAGSMHLIDMSHGVLGASAVVGTTIPIAAGYALVMKREKNKRVVVCMFGDGATEEGCFSETLNFAALHKLPMLFVCENNDFAIHTPTSKRWATQRLRERVETYGIPTGHVDDGDVFAIRDMVANRLESIRAGSGPQFVEFKTYRWLEHVGPTDDHNQGYRTTAEFDRWKANDQITRLEKMLGAEAAAIQAKVEAELKDAIDFAEKSPYPEADQLMRYVYA